MFDGLRERVREYRNEQDEIAIQKAEAVIQYAVSTLQARLSFF
jgi:hypothetical protein